MTKTTNIIGYNNDSKNIFTTLGGVYDEELSKKVNFIKDPDKLLYQYNNLIKALGRQYAQEFRSKSEVEDLFSYISDTFVSLVKEYDVSSEVDFAGYIAINLKARVKYSYVNLKLGRANRVTTLVSPTLTVEDILDTKQLYGDTSITDKKGNLTGFLDHSSSNIESYTYNESYTSLLDELRTNLDNFSNLDEIIINLIYMNVSTVNSIYQELLKNDINIDKRSVVNSYNKIKEYMRTKLK